MNSKFEFVKLQISHLRLLPSQKVMMNPGAEMEEALLITSFEIGKPNPTSHNSHKFRKVWTVGTWKMQPYLPNKHFHTSLIKIFMTSTESHLLAEFWLVALDPTSLPCHGPIVVLGP